MGHFTLNLKNSKILRFVEEFRYHFIAKTIRAAWKLREVSFLTTNTS